MKLRSSVAYTILTLISIYYSALVLWLDHEFSTFSDLLSQGVWIFWLGGSVLWWVLLIVLFQFVQLRKWSAFFIGTGSFAIFFSCLIILLAGSGIYTIIAFTKLTFVIATFITIGVIGSWGLSAAADLLVKIFPERFIP